MTVELQIVFETHSISEDNERAVASGWDDPALSPRGRALALELSKRRAGDGLSLVYSSDLRRAAETAEIAFANTSVQVELDHRLRECNYGILNGEPASKHHAERHLYIEAPYPGGESWRQAAERFGEFLLMAWQRHQGERILLIGHIATRWALDHYLNGVPLESLTEEEFAWQEGWEYVMRGT